MCNILWTTSCLMLNQKLLASLWINASVLLAYLVDMHCFHKEKWDLEDGFFFKTVEIIQKNTQLSRYQQKKWLKILIEKWFIEIEKKWMPLKQYFRVNIEKIEQFLNKKEDTQEEQAKQEKQEAKQEEKDTKKQKKQQAEQEKQAKQEKKQEKKEVSNEVKRVIKILKFFNDWIIDWEEEQEEYVKELIKKIKDIKQVKEWKINYAKMLIRILAIVKSMDNGFYRSFITSPKRLAKNLWSILQAVNEYSRKVWYNTIREIEEDIEKKIIKYKEKWWDIWDWESILYKLWRWNKRKEAFYYNAIREKLIWKKADISPDRFMEIWEYARDSFTLNEIWFALEMYKKDLDNWFKDDIIEHNVDFLLDSLHWAYKYIKKIREEEWVEYVDINK